jgi:hypothetical protein
MIITLTPTAVSSGIAITLSNVLTNVVPVVTDGAIGAVPSNVTNPDHSLTLSSGISVTDFSLSFGPLVDVTYVAISGHDAATPTQASIEIFDGLSLVDSVVLQRNNNVMFTFDLRSFTDLVIKFVTVPNTFVTTVSYIAAGQHMLISGGEQAGYKRNWLKRHLRQKTTTGLQSSPIATTKRRRPLRASLSLPNELVAFSRGTWQTFLDFAETQPFFIREVDALPESTYICYDHVEDVVAHAQTRRLDVLRLSFLAYNGL